MKKSIFSKIVAVSIVSLFMASCSENAGNDKIVETNFGKALTATIETYQKSIDTVSEYVSLDDVPRDLNSSSNYFQAVGQKLPGDLSTLSRKVSSDSRSAEAKEITLKDELDSILNYYTTQINELVPDTTGYNEIDGVIIEDEKIYLQNGIIVPTNSLEGLALLEYLDLVKETGDVQKSLDQLKKEFEQIVKEHSAEMSDRGIALTIDLILTGHPWDGGIIYYYWGAIEEEHKQSLKRAMNTWSKETDNVIRFAEFNTSDWNMFCRGIGTAFAVEMLTERSESFDGIQAVLVDVQI